MSSPLSPSSAQLDAFVVDGVLRVDQAFSTDLAAACRDVLWRAVGAVAGCTPDDPSTWTQPVVRLGVIPHPLLREAINTSRLHATFDALVGAGRWQPPGAVGTFPVRFPSTTTAGDDGWHIDVSFGFDGEPDFLQWRANIHSRGRALLLLMLFSDVDDDDAPTRLRLGSHLDIARRLAPHGDDGLTLGALASTGFVESAHRRELRATGPAGTVFVCHPFLVHAAQAHHGTRPRFLAQPPVVFAPPLDRYGVDDDSPVARAIRLALTTTP